MAMIVKANLQRRNMMNEYELSASIHLWEPILYDDREVIIDVYYCENGFPAKIHDNYGADEVDKFRIELIDEIKRKNKSDGIWRISSDAFAVLSKKKNVEGFNYEYKNCVFRILRKTVRLGVIK